MSTLAQSNWRSAYEQGKGRDGKATENRLQAHLELVHGYAAAQLTGLEIIQLVFLHEAQHPAPRGHGKLPVQMNGENE
jgi:hypothetical protein